MTYLDTCRDEGGQTLVVAALSMVALLAMLALVLDGGIMLVQRRHMQNAADAASAAGARELALGSDDGTILSRVQEYGITRNGAEGVEAWYADADGTQISQIGQGNVPGSAVGVIVTTEIQFPTFFAGIVGITNSTARAIAGAQYGAPEMLGNLWPLAVREPEEGLEFEAPYQFEQYKTGPGGFGWLDFDGPPFPISELASQIENPANEPLSVGSQVGSSPGNDGNARQVRDAMRTWIDNDRHATLIFYNEEPEQQGANLTYTISGFAEFVITGYDYQSGQGGGQGSDKQYGDCDLDPPPGGICGRFVKWTEPTSAIAGPGGGNGVYGVRFFNP